MSEKVETSGAKSITVIVQSENVFNTGISLTESNYDVWSQLMEMHIAEREKFSYMRGKKAPPTKSEDGYEKWYAENQKRYLRLPTAQEIWNALSKAFYDGSDELRLTEIFRELDHRDKIIMKDADDIAAYRKSIKRLRVHNFLAGLDGAFEQVRGEILCKDPIPDLEQCYALVCREAVRQTTLKGEYNTSDILVMVAQRSKTSNLKANPVDKSSLKCTYFLADIPNQSSSIEGILNLESESSRKQLLHRHNRGIPKPTYEPELSSRVPADRGRYQRLVGIVTSLISNKYEKYD
ncbi:hypothetical protein ACOSQ4_024439 [Xanthoceras sorbifolium]